MYKVLALDLDGTVLTDDHSIHPEVKKAIQEAQQKCHVVIVTGRHHTAHVRITMSWVLPRLSSAVTALMFMTTTMTECSSTTPSIRKTR